MSRNSSRKRDRPAGTPTIAGETGVIRQILLAGAVLIPLTVIPSAKDPFRIPKELEFRAVAILILVTTGIAGTRWLIDRRWKLEFALVLAICGWAATATLLSDNRALSVRAMITIVAGAIIFLAATAPAAVRPAAWLPAVLIPAVVNAAIILLEAAEIWSPFGTHTSHFETALLGNRNDTAVYLLGPAVLAVVLATETAGRVRHLHVVIAAFLLAGLAATQTFTALGAYTIAVLGFLAITRHRVRLVMLGGGMALAVAAAGISMWSAHSVGQMTTRFVTKAAAVASGNLDVATTGRIGAYLTAWEMFKDNPVAGVGPDVFRYHYFQRRNEVERKYPTRIWPGSSRENFGEVHNDHLQVLAETGLIGYILFFAAGLYVASRSFQRPADEESEHKVLARSLAFPLAIAFLVVAAGQFPIELAAPRYTFLLLGAICCGWTR